ncbi:hypothetical protein BON30_33535 [Cystobacter ferrugineus]|uniref:Uncharacterized protein n=1 Tax=Cystobacter ferrugineus TaxID=83449 RepID=A0A1L9B334_9BACT|nr:hypothetical protein BON30_33535 [Cystobacter ferrugineus]
MLEVSLQYLAVALIGACVGIGELVSRYQDNPYEAIRNRHAVLYTVINVLAAIVALLALKTVRGQDPLGDQNAADRIGYTLLAGFGAMGILRSSAFTLRAGNNDVSIGPSALLQIILSATDRAVDRARATVRAERMAKTMKDLEFSHVAISLPQLAFTMMQNVTMEEKQDLAEEISRLREQDMDAAMKSICLGLALSNIVGQSVVDAAVAAIRQTRKPDAAPAPIQASIPAEALVVPSAAPR